MEEESSALSDSRPRDLISPVILALDPEAILNKMVDALDFTGAYTAFMSFFDDAGNADPVVP